MAWNKILLKRNKSDGNCKQPPEEGRAQLSTCEANCFPKTLHQNCALPYPEDPEIKSLPLSQNWSISFGPDSNFDENSQQLPLVSGPEGTSPVFKTGVQTGYLKGGSQEEPTLSLVAFDNFKRYFHGHSPGVKEKAQCSRHLCGVTRGPLNNSWNAGTSWPVLPVWCWACKLWYKSQSRQNTEGMSLVCAGSIPSRVIVLYGYQIHHVGT